VSIKWPEFKPQYHQKDPGITVFIEIQCRHCKHKKLQTIMKIITLKYKILKKLSELKEKTDISTHFKSTLEGMGGLVAQR
jgi:uncharacterized radical SAM superfamily protein